MSDIIKPVDVKIIKPKKEERLSEYSAGFRKFLVRMGLWIGILLIILILTKSCEVIF